jgi:ribonuclease BN (tRNA processing enzyme)
VTRVTFLGSGDAFGSGGRLETSLLLESAGGRFLVDCGASALAGLKQRQIAPSSIDAILISHLHGDHFGGVPSFVLDAQFTRRQSPLVIVGPPGLRARVRDAMEIFYPRSSETQQRFPIEFIELDADAPRDVGPLRITAYPVVHFCGAPPYALRVEADGRTITYSGDTEWTDRLIDAAAGADLFICEAYFFEKKVKFHMDYRTLASHRDALSCRRIVLTHMSPDMLARTGEVEGFEIAEDGLVVTL